MTLKISKLRTSKGFLLSGCLILFQLAGALAQNVGRIVNGVSTTIEEAPFLVQFRRAGDFFCAGTLVSDYYVITAAHCLNGSDSQLTVVGGATTISEPGTAQSKILAYTKPQICGSETLNVDIMVVKLRQPLRGAFIKPIAMGCDKWDDNAVVKIFGWGQLHEAAEELPLQLQTTELRALDNNWCQWLYFNRRVIRNFMFCATARGSDACYGDSGGPAIVNNQFCGVISWGVGCAHAESPGVYTNLRVLRRFIQASMEALDKVK